MERELTMEEKLAFIEKNLQTPEGRYVIAQTMLEPSDGGLVKSGYMLGSGVNPSSTGNKTSENLEGVPTISRKDQSEKSIPVGGVDYVSCAICGFKALDLNSHIRRIHGMTAKEYRKKYPGRKIVCDALVGNRKMGVSEKVKQFCRSELGKRLLKEANEKRLKTNLKKYGVLFPNQKKAIQSIKKLWEDPEWKKLMLEKLKSGVSKKYGVNNVMEIPEVRKKAIENCKKVIKEKYGVNNPGQLGWVQMKIRKAQKLTPNKTERYLMQFLPDFVKYAGDGSFWIKFADGKVKNPDFVVRPFRKWRSVIELFSRYYHKPEEEQELIQKYAEVGVKCLVIWDDELKNKKTRKRMLEKIINFLTLESSETNTPDTSDTRGEDRVQNPAF